MMKKALERIGHGLLFGIGFAFAYLVFSHLFTQWQMASLEESVFDETMFKEYGSDAGLTMKAHRPQKKVKPAISRFPARIAPTTPGRRTTVTLS
jgi:hypothetical protein